MPLFVAPARPPIIVALAPARASHRITRLAALAVLAGLIVAVVATARGAYLAFTDAWVAPLQLSPDSREVVALRVQASKEKEQRARLESELTSAAAEAVAIDLGLKRLRSLADGYAKAVRWSSSDRGGQLSALVDQKQALERQRAMTLDSIQRDEATVTRARRELEAGLITASELEVAQSNLAHAQLTKAEKELEYLRVTAALDEATRQTDALVGAAGRPLSGGRRGAHLASPDVMRLDEVQINVELQIARLEADRRAAEGREHAARAGITGMDELSIELETTPLFLAAGREIDLAFVPYAHLEKVRAGDPVYRCRWFLFGCREAGRIKRIFPGEVVTDDPWGSVARGHYVELEMVDRGAMVERTLRVRRSAAAAPDAAFSDAALPDPPAFVGTPVMTERIVWYLASLRSFVEASPLLRAVAVCAVLYQLDVVAVLVAWLLRKGGLLPTEVALEPANRKDALVVLPTLLRKRGELEGLIGAMRSLAHNGYPGRLHVIACIDGIDEAADLFDDLVTWTATERVPPGVKLYAVATDERVGKAVAMEHGVDHMKGLVARGVVDRFPEVFFNMDADSELGPRALERMVYRLTRRRRLTRRPFHIVTSNVIVPFDQCWQGARTLLTVKGWLALSVAREYVGSISAGKVNCKLSPGMEVSGALYCTWSDVYLAAARYAAFIQTLRIRDWVKWWFGWAPPRFADFDGAPSPEAMTGPGDDTWMGWFACCCGWRNGRLSAELPRTPLHALGRLVLQYLSRPLAYDPLAKVYSKTPTTVRALFKQRLRWNSSRMQDLLRQGPSLAFHWQAAVPVLFGTAVVFIAITMFAAAPLLWVGLLGRHTPPPGPAFAVLATAGYYVSRSIGTVVGLLISDSPRREWVKLLALPISVPYHIFFNTLTLLIGYYRDAFGFGEPTTFAPERTLVRSNLSRFALAYRVRRALLLAARAAVHGDVPFGWFWLGWQRTPFTSCGFDGWTSGQVPPAVFWPQRVAAPPRLDVS